MDAGALGCSLTGGIHSASLSRPARWGSVELSWNYLVPEGPIDARRRLRSGFSSRGCTSCTRMNFATRIAYTNLYVLRLSRDYFSSLVVLDKVGFECLKVGVSSAK